MNLSKKTVNEIFDKIKQVYPVQHASSKSKIFDIFLSYSFSDADYAEKIHLLLEQYGCSVFMVNKDDSHIDKIVDAVTAKRLANYMNHSKSLVYLHTKAATVSKWCPWELGYVSGKTNFKCAKMLLKDDDEVFEYQEYLGIYPNVEFKRNGASFIFSVVDDDGKSMELKSWIAKTRKNPTGELGRLSLKK